MLLSSHCLLHWRLFLNLFSALLWSFHNSLCFQVVNWVCFLYIFLLSTAYSFISMMVNPTEFTLPHRFRDFIWQVQMLILELTKYLIYVQVGHKMQSMHTNSIILWPLNWGFNYSEETVTFVGHWSVTSLVWIGRNIFHLTLLLTYRQSTAALHVPEIWNNCPDLTRSTIWSHSKPCPELHPGNIFTIVITEH